MWVHVCVCVCVWMNIYIYIYIYIYKTINIWISFSSFISRSVFLSQQKYSAMTLLSEWDWERFEWPPCTHIYIYIYMRVISKVLCLKKRVESERMYVEKVKRKKNIFDYFFICQRISTSFFFLFFGMQKCFIKII